MNVGICNSVYAELFEDGVIKHCYSNKPEVLCEGRVNCLLSVPSGLTSPISTQELCMQSLSSNLFESDSKTERENRSRFFFQIKEKNLSQENMLTTEKEDLATKIQSTDIQPPESIANFDSEFKIFGISDQDILADYYAEAKKITIISAKNAFDLSKCFMLSNQEIPDNDEFLNGEHFRYSEFIDSKILETKYLLSKYSRSVLLALQRNSDQTSYNQNLDKMLFADKASDTRTNCNSDADDLKNGIYLCRSSRQNTIYRETNSSNYTGVSSPDVAISLVCQRSIPESSERFSSNLFPGSCQIENSEVSEHDSVRLSGNIVDVMKAKDILGAISLDALNKDREIFKKNSMSINDTCKYARAKFNKTGLIVSQLSSSREREAMIEKAEDRVVKFYQGMRSVDSANEIYSTRVFESYSKKISNKKQSNDADRLRNNLKEK